MLIKTGFSMNNKPKLSLKKQVHITLETQEEINQLFAILNFIPISSAIDLENNDWLTVKEQLKATDYFQWHANLNSAYENVSKKTQGE